ncbi:class I SAM-dependent methyltransferase [Mycolicibacterium smegmatis]|uniref:Transferase n=3 Tax=Mycolicibacterium smegmatis TaxID=1772 RepID=I7G9H1_MYCS2|nr:class I SAM-dependent methyltransferase [Mycolicibacterium smegmatis]ABK74184.1 methyltransferase type 12, putative [Mycolicibacterium smegmatis MC2 155]AFP42247.1 hypothetical protein MSMEI_5814 [Mycolicibacterium smegmatis MC2 155]AIU10974.1 transferase [Mycolicibacterium smegmatis MC2 155]AIU17598.1 transferase [Mycolicibacterium smegmatis]AIU24222.1 transferase [Mycolicibacterium smegmatis]
MNACRGCGKTDLTRVLDLGKVPASDHFPLVTAPVSSEETSHPLAMDMCGSCGLAQLADDDTVSDEPRGVEPQALKDQAAAAVAMVDVAGWLRGSTVLEFGSPHGGTWLPWLTDRGFTAVHSQADVVLDCFGIMHESDQRRAFEERARQIQPGGVLLLQYHSIMTIVREGQWNALRHGHFAYYSLSALVRLLGEVGLRVATAWEFDLYGGTVLLAAVPEDVDGDAVVARILKSEDEFGISDPAVVAALQRRADLHVNDLRSWLEAESSAGRTVFAYGAASRAVALFSRAGLDSRLVAAVADAAPAKLGRRMPGTDIPIVSPDELLAANPDSVLLTVPDLLGEVSSRYPELDGRWKVDR